MLDLGLVVTFLHLGLGLFLVIAVFLDLSFGLALDGVAGDRVRCGRLLFSMKKFVNLVALGALAATLVIATGCNKSQETTGGTTEAPKVVEETTTTTTTTTTPSTETAGTASTASTETATTSSTASTTTTTTTPSSK